MRFSQAAQAMTSRTLAPSSLSTPPPPFVQVAGENPEVQEAAAYAVEVLSAQSNSLQPFELVQVGQCSLSLLLLLLLLL